ncbi:Phasin family protein [Candidatus Trichorickettsia mobilis]|uniref:Phasin family protein n=1 Tax=Candidatus Trichorickettsia mobilis TaxID=1346319 RepID=A0ABZ0UT40_9RICK|nr:phasin family protein [Candidatus Trichorickettsia mobilis]WPY01187.1 Phasin family protein [Candidatus Trichorickettsia mobilis]
MNKDNGSQSAAQFFDTMKSFMNPEAFLGNMKNIPTMDFSSFTNGVKKNTEILTTANQLASDSAQVMVKRSAEALQNSASEMFNTVKEILSAENIEEAAACQQQYIKSAIENSMNNSKEIVDMMTKASMEIFQLMGNGVSEHVDHAFTKKCTSKS